MGKNKKKWKVGDIAYINYEGCKIKLKLVKAVADPPGFSAIPIVKRNDLSRLFRYFVLESDLHRG